MKSTFIKESTFNVSVDRLFSWHERDGVIKRLTPCWEKVVLLSQTGKISENPQVFFKVKAGPFWIDYVARHVEYEKNKIFVDIQEKGPFRSYKHSHIFKKSGDISSQLKDNVEFEMPLHFLTKYFVVNKFRRIFDYRHTITRNDIDFLEKFDAMPMRIAVTGASGDIGRNLLPLLQTHGHKVVRLIRDKGLADEENYYWDIDTGKIYGDNLNFDAVIHLAGKPIGNKRWNDKIKGEIVKSRIGNTKKLAEFILSLENKPKVFISASAIGYYGETGDKFVTEEDSSGGVFISYICKNWEESANILTNNMRVVNLRIGVVMSYCGGALNRVLPFFNAGLGVIFGKGDNYLSWVSMDDVLYSILFSLYKDDIRGAVNVVSPNPVLQKDYAKILAKVLKRPQFVKVPEKAVELLFGQMGREILLTSTRVYPKKLLDNGFKFYFSDLEYTIRHTLGR
ncbi:TIGR01777 family protein [Deferribacteraceae bacterium V6Fe1]|nr:TIGR01777 family protein [Deferribacteraceae bacterium V6Fe1]